MLPNEVLNHMEADELRNYACLLENITNIYGELVWSCDDVCKLWKDLYSAIEHKDEVLSSLNSKQATKDAVTRKMLEKYKEYLPRPVCGKEG